MPDTKTKVLDPTELERIILSSGSNENDTTRIMSPIEITRMENIAKIQRERLPYETAGAVALTLVSDPAIHSITEYLGEGGLGKVYGAKVFLDGRLREVAIKALAISNENYEVIMDMDDADRIRHEDFLLAMFKHEAAVQGRFNENHPHIVSAYALREIEHVPYMVMELVKGSDLGALMDKGIDDTGFIDALMQTTKALKGVHEEGFIHRDVKPQNILVQPNGIIKLTDFGLAKQIENFPNQYYGDVFGTPRFMAPEQKIPGMQMGPKIDMYAIGAVIRQHIYEKDTFYPCDDNRRYEDSNWEHRENPFHEALRRTARHCMKFNPDARFDSMDELLTCLKLIHVDPTEKYFVPYEVST